MDDKTELFERIYKADNETLERILNELRMAAPKEPYKLLDTAHRIYTCTQEDAPGTAGLFQPREWRIVLVRDRPNFENTLALVRRYMDEDISVSEYMSMNKDEERLYTLCRKLADRIEEDDGAEFAEKVRYSGGSDAEIEAIPYGAFSVWRGLRRREDVDSAAMILFQYGVACGKRIERRKRKPA